MELLKAIQDYINKLLEYGYYPKKKKPSIGKLERMADLCMDGKIRKITRYVPDTATEEEKDTLDTLIKKIEEIIKNEKQDN